MKDVSEGSPVIVGEVLFDCFPDGTAVMGGAPFNVAWHLQGLELSPLIITAIGDDAHGEQVVKAMRDWGMDTRGVQVDKQHPTGQVEVTLQGSIPSYEIVADQAYDFIDAAAMTSLINTPDHALLYHGSLVSRTADSRVALDSMIAQGGLPTFVDINLRAPWWTHADINHSLHRAVWVKLNDEELVIVMSGAEGKVSNTASAKDATRFELQSLAKQCLEYFNLELLIVTRGDKGAFCIFDNSVIHGSSAQAEHVMDTVGAGDAFCAVMIAGLIRQWPLEITLERALQFATVICGIRGATTTDRGMYETFLGEWQE